MLSATNTSDASPLRVPAWKRLGLKLKSAQDLLDSPVIVKEPALELPDAKRKRLEEIGDSLPDSKRSRKSYTLQDSAPLVQKKSVSFTPETKTQDGDSIKQLFNSWVAEQKSQDSSFRPNGQVQALTTPRAPQVEEQFDTTIPEGERRVKRVTKPRVDAVDTLKNKKDKRLNSDQLTRTGTRPFLEYIKQYSESKETWKFHKNHQNHLLKHAFDVEVIPSDYAHLLYEYVRGLQGAVRTRLRDIALAIKVKDLEEGATGFPDGMVDMEAKQEEYDTALKEYVATMTVKDASSKLGYEEGILLGLSDAAMAKRAAKRMRAEQILSALGDTESEAEPAKDTTGLIGDDDSQKRLRLNNGSSQRISRRRKQRTLAVEESSSSSQESSDSDSESDSDESSSDESSERDAAHRTAREDTSSSSSSSSSDSEVSDSDDESEEGSEESDGD